ncbi:YggS family pyridoxal phosphate-dependent enzyme [Nannocystis bainbridge]|uniref:Pyridoxal phosphate homeostasis protein n=1 Tax=Nannocystis bainbridge TaxID=2995303 RepID=A0ABT5ECS2_9BACT|nr:YggS family pyridoxal phosphate-dependent enzyme [Nannocystis bainbridge]MDC0722703.1 YggS family pyridoxal phosphate-dependent enzyme [Nannocystis bainbridge]
MSLTPDDIAANLAAVRARVAAAVARRGPGPVPTLIGVSKKQPPEAVIAACHAGLGDFGENYAQELVAKVEVVDVAVTPPRWHFIGPLQTNKVRKVVGVGALVHTVDRPTLVDELAREVARLRAGRGATTPLELLVEVNVGDEAQKAGVTASELPALLDRVAARPELRCVGLMAIPPEGDPEQTRPHFARLRELARREAAIARPGVDLVHLSMGMSADFEVAIEEGATMVRVGTAIFGARPPRA